MLRVEHGRWGGWIRLECGWFLCWMGARRCDFLEGARCAGKIAMLD